MESTDLLNHPLVRFAIASGLGVLLGLEREYSYHSSPIMVAGIRTFPLIAAFGFICSMLGGGASFLPLIAGMVVIGALAVSSYHYAAQQGKIGITTETALIVTYTLGAAVQLGFLVESVAIGITAAILLSMKSQLRGIVEQLAIEDIHTLLKFVVIAALILPLVPDESFGPGNVLNPRSIWLVVVLVTAVSFAGYLLMKFLGTSRGALITAMLGSLVSSTAVTWEFSKKSVTDEGHSRVYAGSIIIASSIMFFRVIGFAYLMNPAIISYLALPLIAMAAAGLISGWLIVRSQPAMSSEATTDDVEIVSRLGLASALQFGVVYVAIKLAVVFAKEYVGNAGVYAAGALSGITDVDAITISMAQSAGASIEFTVAVATIILATMFNTLVKAVISSTRGSKEVRRLTQLGFGAIVCAGVAGILKIWLVG
ncbi:MAG: MgtC/SapB family protein [Candidatus Kapabacteria bacterium]|nr:MgtC/SapB family protein [Candidatus Kapabacteria bacterium]